MLNMKILLRSSTQALTRRRCTKSLSISTPQRRPASAAFEPIAAHGAEFPKTIKKDGSVYYAHIETTWLQNSLLAVGSSVASILDPTRTEMVATLCETTASRALCQSLLHKMANDPVGKVILKEKPIINSQTVDLNALQSLPDDTLGKHYATFMTSLGLTADTRCPVCFIKDPDLAYVMFRYRTIHDFTHILLGMPSITVAAEVAVKWFEMVQTGFPMTVFASTFGLFANGISPSERQVLVKDLIPWALLCGRNAKFLLNIYFEKELERNIHDLRAEIGVVPAPVVL